MLIKKLCFKKHKGASLLMIVLIGFLTLSTLSAVAINIASQVVRNEIWQTKGSATNRLNHLARSSANAAVEAIIKYSEENPEENSLYFGSATEIAAGVSSERVTLINDTETGISNDIQIKVQGSRAHTVSITSTAYEGERRVGVIAKIDMVVNPKTVSWSIKK